LNDNQSQRMELRPKKSKKNEAYMASITKSGVKTGDEAVAIIKQLPALDTGATDHITNVRPNYAVNIRKCDLQ
jgi:hypothetical protein